MPTAARILKAVGATFCLAGAWGSGAIVGRQTEDDVPLVRQVSGNYGVASALVFASGQVLGGLLWLLGSWVEPRNNDPEAYPLSPIGNTHRI